MASNASPVPVPVHVPAGLVQDINLLDAPGLDRDPPPVIDSYRDGRPIVFWPGGRRGAGAWVLKTFDLVSEALQSPERFSSDRYSGFSALIGENWPMLPLEVDPPKHMPYRLFLNKVFSPSRMRELDGGIAQTVSELTAAVRGKGRCEFQSAFGVPLPTTVFVRLMGLPLGDAPQLLEWEFQLLHGVDMAARADAARSIKEYLVTQIVDRERSPREDVVSYIANTPLEGQALSAEEKLGMCYVLYGAGLDTVAAALGFIFKYLAENQDRQAELRGKPEQRQPAIEELLRAASMVVPGRWVTRDMEFHGVRMKKGDHVLLPTMMGNRDPRAFADPATVDFGRGGTARHIAFGTGVHNCLGSHLARRELRIALDEWLDRMPPFRIGSEAPVTYGGPVFGVSSLALAWN